MMPLSDVIASAQAITRAYQRDFADAEKARSHQLAIEADLETLILRRSEIAAAPASTVDEFICLLRQLRGARLFEDLYAVATALTDAGVRWPELLRQRAQAAIELKLFPTAVEDLYRVLLASDASEHDRQEARSLLGRANKQQYMDTASEVESGRSKRSRAAFLRAALAHYAGAYADARGDRSPGWSANAHYPGVNVIALVWRAEHDRIAVADLLTAARLEHVTARDLAIELLDDLVPVARENRGDAWVPGSVGEALLAVPTSVADERSWETPEAWLSRHAASKTSTFHLYSTTRQLEEVWLVKALPDPRAAALAVMKAATMRLGGDVLVSAADLQGFARASSADAGKANPEKLIAGVVPESFDWIFSLKLWADAIARIQRSKDKQHYGTGFVFDGRALRLPQYRGRKLFLTNAHVVSSNPVDWDQDALSVDEIEIEFFRHVDGRFRDQTRPPLLTRQARVLWCSPQTELDATILELPELDGVALPALELIDVAETDARRDIGTALVVGYPDGGSLAFNLRNNDVVDWGWLDPVRQNRRYVHYVSSTDEGQSGSPVFNESLGGVYAMHQAGPKEHHLSLERLVAKREQTIPRLNGVRDAAGRPSRWVANQGILISSILAEARVVLAEGNG